MPRLPKGMLKRGKSFYFRGWYRRKEVWRSLGPDHQEATRRFRLIKAQGGARGIIEGSIKAEETANKPVTVRELGRKWLAEYIATRRNERCAKEAESRFRRFTAPLLGHLEISQVRPDHFRRLRLEVEQHGLAPVSVGHVLGDARCLFRYIADELRLIPRSPFPPRIMPRVEEVAPRRLSMKEIEQVLRSVPEEHGFIIRLALATGLRWGEVHRLQWRHVDWNSRQLVIERTKSGKVRRVPVTAETLDMLRQQFGDSKSIFVSPYRKKDSGSFLHFVKKKSGLKAFGFHKLRHTFACEWLEAGGSKEALQKMLGHSTIRLTERYGQVSDDYVLKELETVARTVAAREDGVHDTTRAVR